MNKKAETQLAIDMVKIQQMHREEMIWLDGIIRKQWPVFLVKLAEGRLYSTWIGRCLHFIMARCSGVRVERGRAVEILGGKGFRNGQKMEKLKEVKVSVYKGKKLLEERIFPLNIIKRI